MCDRDDLVFACEHHFMFAYDRAAANGVHADLFFIARAHDTASSVYVGFLSVKRFVYGIGKHQSRAAGGVFFQVVVFFDNFHVEFIAQNLCRRLAKGLH